MSWLRTLPTFGFAEWISRWFQEKAGAGEWAGAPLRRNRATRHSLRPQDGRHANQVDRAGEVRVIGWSPCYAARGSSEI
jgi:hypothetical protein